jgi:Protein of unknown function (DUF3887)
MADDVPPDVSDRAQRMFGYLSEGRWEQARSEFDVTMRRRADPERLRRGWTNVAGPAGRFAGIGAPAAWRSGDYTLVLVPLTFDNGTATGRIVLNDEGEVAGLSLEYPRRRRLDPRTVRVFFLKNPDIGDLLHARVLYRSGKGRVVG